MHGKDNPKGMHKGDLPNLLAGADGRGSFEYTIPNATLSGMSPNKLIDEDGAAIVIHAKADDFRTDPSGNSGDRIACGVLG
jgi:Cu-Zn family superoxide dismutase